MPDIVVLDGRAALSELYECHALIDSTFADSSNSVYGVCSLDDGGEGLPSKVFEHAEDGSKVAGNAEFRDCHTLKV